MTNYKRFISYLYSYELGTKKGNVGFARVETSNELCKLTLHGNLNQGASREARVLIFKGKKDSIDAIETEHIKTVDGAFDLRIIFDKGNMQEGKFLFQDGQGVLVMFNRENYIAARWNDEPVTYDEVRTIERNLSTPAIPQSAVQTKKEEVSKPEASDMSGLRTEYVDPDSIQIIEVKPKTEVKEKVLEGTPEEIPTEMKKEDSKECPEEQLNEHPIEPIPEKAILIAQTVLNSESEGEVVLEQGGDETQQSASKQEDVNTDGELINSETQDTADAEEKESELSIASYNKAAQEGLWIDHPSARLILNKFVRMYPFDDGEIAECVRLEPKDIGLLPMSTWVLGNNSFLLHAYCNFRHILFAKKLTRTGCEYLLMVPGVMNKHEEQLAKMFGFQNFKCSRRRYARSGEFGYWYIPINFSS